MNEVPFFNDDFPDQAASLALLGGPLPRPIFKTAHAFCCEYRPLAYVVEPIIRTSSVYTLTAKTGGGKTAFNVILGLSVATGRRDIIGLDVERGRVAYLAFENPDDVRMRIMVAGFLLNIDLDAIGADFVILDARAKPEELVKELRTMSSAGGEFVLVIVDTFAAAFDGKDVNDNVEAGEFVRRLRPITQMEGLPAVLIAAHPTKNASEDQIVPYGGGAILNEVDGNLTLAKRSDTGNTELHWKGKFRGLEFQPIHFRFEIVASPDVIDNKGRQVQLPVLRPCTAEDVENRAQLETNIDLAILRALAVEPLPTLRQIGLDVGRSKTAVIIKLNRLAKEKMVEKVLDRWHLTTKGAVIVRN